MNTHISNSISISNNFGMFREDARNHAVPPSNSVGGSPRSAPTNLTHISSEPGTAGASNNANAPAVSNTADLKGMKITIDDAESIQALSNAASSPRSVTSAPFTQR